MSNDIEIFDTKGDYLGGCPPEEAEALARQLREDGFNPIIHEED